PDAFVALVLGLEVDVAAAGRERPEALPRVADPLREALGTGLAGIPHPEGTDRIARVAVSDGAVVGLAVADGAAQVQDGDLAVAGRALLRQLAAGVEQLVAELGQVL